MSQIITAPFENGVLKPEQLLDLPAGARVQLILQPLLSDEDSEKA